jgi:aminoglycoside phosphotransferase (APT) family kinase protein
MSNLDSLPPPEREAARAALREALGTTPIEAVAPVSGGTTAARLFRIDAGGRHYLLRMEGPVSPLQLLRIEGPASTLQNPHQYIPLRIAAEAGIAPRLYYADEGSRIAVMDFVSRRPLGTYAGGLSALTKALGELLARLHATPAFPHLVRYPEIVARLWSHVCRSGLFAPGVLDRYSEHFEHIRAAYIWNDANSLSSHNDSIPANVLYDGNRLWMIDWESAYRNDPLVDIAIMSDSVARSPELEDTLLRSCLGRAPDAAVRERLRLVRALNRLYYASVLLSASATAPRTAPDTGTEAPTPEEFKAAIRSGRLKARTPAARHVLGKMFLASFMNDVATPGYDLTI